MGLAMRGKNIVESQTKIYGNEIIPVINSGVKVLVSRFWTNRKVVSKVVMGDSIIELTNKVQNPG